MTKVFISYSHDSPDHSERVRAFGASLSRDGCEVSLDIHKDTDEDWPAWMTRQLVESDFVLCVVTETYARRFSDKELPDIGLGVGWESGLIRRLLYAKKLRNGRIFPVVLAASDRAHIPLELQGYDYFVLNGQSGYVSLLRKLLNLPLHAKPDTGKPPDLQTQPPAPMFARPGSDAPPPRVTHIDVTRISHHAPADQPIVRRITNSADPDLKAAVALLPVRIPDALDPEDLIRWIHNDPKENVLLVAKIGTSVWGFLLFHYILPQRIAFFAYLVGNKDVLAANGQDVSEVLVEELGKLFATDPDLQGCRQMLFEVERPDPARRYHRLESLSRIRLFCRLAEEQKFVLKALDLNYLQPRLSLDRQSKEKPMLLMYAQKAGQDDSGALPREQVEEMLQFVYLTLYPSDCSPDPDETKQYADYTERLFNRQAESLPQEVKALELEEIKARFTRYLVYVSYSHNDKSWHQRLRKVLDADPLIRDLVWDDTKIPVDADFAQEIDEHVPRARVMVMLGSPDYFSPDCGAADTETTPALEARRRGRLHICWFPVRRFDYDSSPVGHLMAATGAGALPLDELSAADQSKALRTVRDAIRHCLGIPQQKKSRRSRSQRTANPPPVETPREPNPTTHVSNKKTSPQKAPSPQSTLRSRNNSEGPMNPKNSQRSIVWLHLSDLHYCEEKTSWDAHRVLEPLTKDLKAMEQDYGLCPQLLFFTGDAAFGNLGNIPGSTFKEQFAGAQQVIESARTSFSTHVPKENVFIVPGNHDVDRYEITDDQTQWLDSLRDVTPITKLIKSAGRQWQRYMDRLAAYREFLQLNGYVHLLVDPSRLIYAQRRELHGVTLGIAGFNTAWSCGRENEIGKLWFGADWQSGELVRQLADVDFSIALTHHPFGWFGEWEGTNIRIHFERDFTFHLHGHEHQAWVDAKADGHVSVAAAACYQCSWMENGYNFVRLNLDTGEVEIWLRRYESKGRGWVPCTVAGTTNNDGIWKLSNLPWLQRLTAKAKSTNP